MNVVKRPQAKRDILEQADYIARDNMTAAERFLRATDKTLHQIAAMPGIGVIRDFDLTPEI
jgi:plasmid stabilization system protein ParE